MEAWCRERETERSQAQKERTRLLDKQYKKPTNIKLHNRLTRADLPEIIMWLQRQIYLIFLLSFKKKKKTLVLSFAGLIIFDYTDS